MQAGLSVQHCLWEGGVCGSLRGAPGEEAAHARRVGDGGGGREHVGVHARLQHRTRTQHSSLFTGPPLKFLIGVQRSWPDNLLGS